MSELSLNVRRGYDMTVHLQGHETITSTRATNVLLKYWERLEVINTETSESPLGVGQDDAVHAG